MGPDQNVTDSVFDFLYVDRHRVALFLSQLDQYGHLTSLTKSTSVSNGSKGTLDAKIAKAEGSSDSSTSLSKHFDTQWTGPLLFLDKSHERGMLKKEIENAHIGQIVLVSGALHFSDPMAMKSSLDIPAVKKLLRNGVQAASRAATPPKRPSTKEQQEQNDTVNLMLDFLKILPHSMQILLVGAQGGVWCSLHNDYLVGSSSDIMLKHGVKIPGQWNIVGILDAKPEEGIAENQEELINDAAMIQFYATIAPIARTMIGRPRHTYGMTPLLIFREIMN